MNRTYWIRIDKPLYNIRIAPTDDRPPNQIRGKSYWRVKAAVRKKPLLPCLEIRVALR
jgi:hypothetical protein